MHHDTWVFLDGSVVAAAEARVSVLDRGFLYGDSVFEVTRTVDRAPLLLEPHLLRLADSAAGLGFDLPPLPEIRAATVATIARCQADECYLRIVVSRGEGPLDLDPATAGTPTLVVIAKPLQLPDARLYREGASVVTVPQRRNAPGHVAAALKSSNYLSSVLALRTARAAGAYEALLTSLDGQLSEGASSNFFIVKDGRVRTPPLAVGLLAGITRAALIALCSDEGVPLDERGFSPSEAQQADEALLTSSIRGLLPVTRIDGEPISGGQVGPLTRRLMAAYQQRYLERKSSASPSRNSSSSSPR